MKSTKRLSFLSEKENSETINAIHENIRKLSKDFDNLLDILRDSNKSFNVLCLTETWCTDSTLKSNKNLHFPRRCYRPPRGDSENLSVFLQKKKKKNHRKIFFRKENELHNGDFNINCLKYHENAKSKHFYDKIFEKGVIPIINRPTRISEHSASPTDNIFNDRHR